MKQGNYFDPRKVVKVTPDSDVKHPVELIGIIREGNYLILDTETTGLTEESEIVSIAVINSAGETLLNQLVRPVMPIPMQATNIHGITNEMVKEAQPFPAVAIRNLIEGQNVVIYNRDYDLSMLYRSNKAARLPFIDWESIAKWHCAMKHFARIYGDWDHRRHSFRWQKLATACAYYNLPQNDAHNALGDCLDTLAVCKAMIAPTKDLF